MSPSLTSPRFISSLSPVTSCNLARPPQHSARHHRSNAVTFAAQHPSPTPQCLLLSIPSPSLAKNALNLKLNLHPDLFPDMIPLAESDNRINQATQEWNYQECSKKHPLFCNQLVRSSSHTYRVDLLWCTSQMKWKPQTENSIITILLHSIQSASDKKSGNMRKKCRSGEVPPKKKRATRPTDFASKCKKESSLLTRKAVVTSQPQRNPTNRAANEWTSSHMSSHLFGPST